MIRQMVTHSNSFTEMLWMGKRDQVDKARQHIIQLKCPSDEDTNIELPYNYLNQSYFLYNIGRLK